MTRLGAGLGYLVQGPLEQRPWIPPAPPLRPAAPVLLPDLPTLQRALEALRRL